MADKKYDTVLIIGNGFDLNLGLKTGYKDFISSEDFDLLLKEENKLCTYLRDKNELNNWIDIENELKEYSLNEFKESNRKVFRQEYQQLCNSLCDYLNNLDISTIDKTSKAYEVITMDHGELLIIDFNYTQSLEYIFKSDIITPKIIKVHGCAKDKRIVFGVEDKAQINQNDVFLKKSTCLWNEVLNIKEILTDTKTIIFLGYSLGETDHHYFNHFFAGLTYKNYNHLPKSIYVSHFHEDGYYDIMRQIDNLTINRINDMRSCHRYEMFDMAKE